jgi:general secretion pathway protein B
MSYILDALRKAEAERQRGAVPGLHDQAGAAGTAAGSGTSQGRGVRLPRLSLLIGLLVVTALVGVLWVYRGLWPGAPVPPPQEREPQATSAQSPAGAQAVQSAASDAAVSVAQAPVPAAATPATGPSPAPLPATATVPAPPVAPAVLPAATPSPTTPRDAVPTTPTTPTTLQSAPAGNAAVTPTPPVPALQTLPRLADLPQAQRRELPPLVVSGAVQSPDPASRMLILDGQVLREGDAPAPGLVLERIGPRAAVFSRGGVRFEIPL